MIRLPQSKTYTLAKALISHLKQGALSDSILAEPCDTQSKLDQLAMATAQYHMGICIVPERPSVIWSGHDDARVPIITANVTVLIFASRTDDQVMSHLASAETCVLQTIQQVINASAGNSFDPYISGIAEMDEASEGMLPNTVGSAIRVSQRTSF